MWKFFQWVFFSAQTLPKRFFPLYFIQSTQTQNPDGRKLYPRYPFNRLNWVIVDEELLKAGKVDMSNFFEEISVFFIVSMIWYFYWWRCFELSIPQFLNIYFHIFDANFLRLQWKKKYEIQWRACSFLPISKKEGFLSAKSNKSNLFEISLDKYNKFILESEVYFFNEY